MLTDMYNIKEGSYNSLTVTKVRKHCACVPGERNWNWDFFFLNTIFNYLGGGGGGRKTGYAQ